MCLLLSLLFETNSVFEAIPLRAGALPYKPPPLSKDMTAFIIEDEDLHVCYEGESRHTIHQSFQTQNSLLRRMPAHIRPRIRPQSRGHRHGDAGQRSDHQKPHPEIRRHCLRMVLNGAGHRYGQCGHANAC